MQVLNYVDLILVMSGECCSPPRIEDLGCLLQLDADLHCHSHFTMLVVHATLHTQHVECQRAGMLCTLHQQAWCAFDPFECMQ